MEHATDVHVFISSSQEKSFLQLLIQHQPPYRCLKHHRVKKLSMYSDTAVIMLCSMGVGVLHWECCARDHDLSHAS